MKSTQCSNKGRNYSEIIAEFCRISDQRLASLGQSCSEVHHCQVRIERKKTSDGDCGAGLRCSTGEEHLPLKQHRETLVLMNDGEPCKLHGG